MEIFPARISTGEIEEEVKSRKRETAFNSEIAGN